MRLTIQTVLAVLAGALLVAMLARFAIPPEGEVTLGAPKITPGG